MKYTLTLLIAMFLLLLPVSQVNAQHMGSDAPDDSQSMMSGGGMHAMMQNPLHQSGMLVFMLPNMKEGLGLSEDQVAGLSELKSQFLENQKSNQELLNQKDKALNDLLTSDSPASTQVEDLVVETATLRAKQRAAAWKTANEMKAVLTPKQKEKLHATQPEQWREQMMAGTTMMDRTHMKNMMSCNMMGQGMMGRGMDKSQMNGRMMNNGDKMGKKTAESGQLRHNHDNR